MQHKPALLLALFSPALTQAAPLDYFLHAAGPAASSTMYLGWGIAALCTVVFIIIAALLWGALKRRRPRVDSRELGKEGGGMAWIYIGAGVSSVALFAVLYFALVVLWTTHQPSSAAPLTITVTAYDWWWKIDYADDADPTRRFTTANEIHIPSGVPVKIELKSADVIHSFWVPQLAGKTQAIPGQTNTQWIQANTPGIYRGQCSQFCGAQHAHMGFEVVAQPRAEFDAWRTSQLRQAVSPVNEPGRTGQKFFMNRCAGCHAVRGTDAVGVFAPDLTHVGSRSKLAAGVLSNTPEHMLEWIEHAQQIKPDSLMPSIALTTQDAAALSAYLATLN